MITKTPASSHARLNAQTPNALAGLGRIGIGLPCLAACLISAAHTLESAATCSLKQFSPPSYAL
jgi:hypothetical protein